jgi:hypothetical protein
MRFYLALSLGLRKRGSGVLMLSTEPILELLLVEASSIEAFDLRHFD